MDPREDNSSTPPNGGDYNRSLKRPFPLGQGGRRDPPPTLFSQSSDPSSSSSSLANTLSPIAAECSPSSRAPQSNLQIQTTPKDSTLTTLTTLPPLHTQAMAVNPQFASPLYGLIPAEIRDQIFEYALTEYTKTDPNTRYSHCRRPEYIGKRAVTISLLLTCRKVYLDTYHLPPKHKEHVFWHECRTYGGRYPFVAGIQEHAYFKQFTPWQMELLKSIHLFTEYRWLEGRKLFQLTKEDFMQGIEKLKITIRRGDICLNPLKAWRKDGWVYAFGNMRALKELEMDFETLDLEVWVHGLQRRIDRARTWKFPLQDGKVLSTEGLTTREWKWRGPMCYWSEHCNCYLSEHCDCYGWDCKGVNAPCVEKRRLRDMRIGPECTVGSLRWRVANATT